MASTNTPVQIESCSPWKEMARIYCKTDIQLMQGPLCKKKKKRKYIFGMGGVRVAGVARGLKRLLQIELRGCHVLPDPLTDVESCRGDIWPDNIVLRRHYSPLLLLGTSEKPRTGRQRRVLFGKGFGRVGGIWTVSQHELEGKRGRVIKMKTDLFHKIKIQKKKKASLLSAYSGPNSLYSNPNFEFAS